jgi:hypothetical protein
MALFSGFNKINASKCHFAPEGIPEHASAACIARKPANCNTNP